MAGPSVLAGIRTFVVRRGTKIGWQAPFRENRVGWGRPCGFEKCLSSGFRFQNYRKTSEKGKQRRRENPGGGKPAPQRGQNPGVGATAPGKVPFRVGIYPGNLALASGLAFHPGSLALASGWRF